jgi:hypothetical protein
VTVTSRPKTPVKPTAGGANVKPGTLVSSTVEVEESQGLDPVALFGAAMELGLDPFL